MRKCRDPDPRMGRRLVWPDVTTRSDHTSIALAAIACAVAIGACGSSSKSYANAGVSPGIRFAQCMRANGVLDFPDGRITPASGINPASPAYESAQNTCKKYLPRARAGPPPTPPSLVREELALARCMRANGVPNFPDPNAQGNIQFPITSPIPQSPAFQRASHGPCKKYSDTLGP